MQVVERGYRDPGFPNQEWPLIPGIHAAGVVEAIASDVSRLKVGDAVMAAVMPRRADSGAQAQFIVVPIASAVAMPNGMSFVEAATLPMNGLTALLALELADLQHGQVLAISGGAGFLGRLAIADARPEDEALVRYHGADVIVPRSQDFAAELRRARPQGADALLDTALVGMPSFAAIRDGRIYISVRGWSGEPAERDIAIKLVLVFEALECTEQVEELGLMTEAGTITTQAAGEYPVERPGDAQSALATGGLRGRPVLLLAEVCAASLWCGVSDSLVEPDASRCPTVSASAASMPR